jgi:hypothetical protein
LIAILLLKCSKRYAEKGDCQQSMNKHGWPEYPPYITVIAKETLITVIFHQLFQQTAARNAPARKENKHTPY